MHPTSLPQKRPFEQPHGERKLVAVASWVEGYACHQPHEASALAVEHGSKGLDVGALGDHGFGSFGSSATCRT